MTDATREDLFARFTRETLAEGVQFAHEDARDRGMDPVAYLVVVLHAFAATAKLMLGDVVAHTVLIASEEVERALLENVGYGDAFERHGIEVLRLDAPAEHQSNNGDV